MTRPILHYPGSKYRLAPWICSQLPPHVSYLEPFFGGGAVFLHKKPSCVETINDIDGSVVNFFRVMRDRPDELATKLELTPWSREEYYEAYTLTGDPLEDARRFAVRMTMAHGARSSERGGWRHDIKGRGSCARTWQQVPERIRAHAMRLRDAQIERQPAVELIVRYRQPGVLIYADPPYVRSTRTGRMYAHEMTDRDHVELLDVLEAHTGPVVLSGYDNELYADRLRHWARRSTTAVTEKAHVRTEVLWLNPMAAAAAPRLFEEASHV